jgi:hypothetical protein
MYRSELVGVVGHKLSIWSDAVTTTVGSTPQRVGEQLSSEMTNLFYITFLMFEG